MRAFDVGGSIEAPFQVTQRIGIVDGNSGGTAIFLYSVKPVRGKMALNGETEVITACGKAFGPGEVHWWRRGGYDSWKKDRFDNKGPVGWSCRLQHPAPFDILCLECARRNHLEW